MSKQNATNNFALLFRWVARIGSIVSAAVIFAFLFGGNERLPQSEEWFQLAFFPGGILLGMALGWKNELVGGVVTIISLFGFYAMQFLQSGSIPVGPWFFIFASPGILFLFAWIADRLANQSRSSIA